MEKVYIFDTTLRDGEQCPGASMNLREKLEVARQLARLNVDIIEAGFPIASQGDFEAIQTIAKEVKGPTIAALARSLKKDIDRAADSLKKAKHRRIHVFLATSKIHMKYKLKKAEDEILKQAVDSVKYARKFTTDVEFSPEDASRSEPKFLAKVVDAVIRAGARTVNIPDTVGYAIPEEFGKLIRYLRENAPATDKAIISVHCHNDLGLAVANSLEAVRNGARQVECTVNGIGERAGNASLEEIVMTLKTRKDHFKGLMTQVNTREITKASRLVSLITGMVVQPNKAVVGENAFAHESGIHQDGILKERLTYEIMDPADVGLTESKLVMGKHSGRHAFKSRLQKMGIQLSDSELNRAFERFKKLADKKKIVYDEDLTAIVEDEISDIPETYRLAYITVTSGSQTVPTATIKLKKEGKLLQDAACGDGPVDAAFKTIDRIVGAKVELVDYNIHAVTKGQDALGEVSIRIKTPQGTVYGKAASTDVIEASAKAYLNAINKALYYNRKKGTKKRGSSFV